MNRQEKELVELLRRMRERGHIRSVKAEFEAEGMRTDELFRLLDVLHRAQVPLTLKIGGCEALRDLRDAAQCGAKFIVAPMIESCFALQKYVRAIHTVFLEDDERADAEFLFNVETVTAHRAAAELAALARSERVLQGVVFGRSDYTASLGPEARVTDEGVLQAVLDVAAQAKHWGLDYGVGGALSVESLPDLRRIREVHLTHFETRKIVFHADALGEESLVSSLLDAVHFEILWLLNKRHYYGALQQEDEIRIRLLESRWDVLGRVL